MLICGLDFETTGLDPTIHKVVEVGMVIWDTDIHQAVSMQGYLVYPNDIDTLVWAAGVEEKTGITSKMLFDYGLEDVKALERTIKWIDQCEAVCAHNGLHCDREFLKSWCARLDKPLPDRLWIDTMTDLELPDKMSKRLSYMAADHGFLNPFPHRALPDVLTMLRILDRYPLERVLEVARSPVVKVYAANLPYAERDKAKERGYHWDPDHKIWWKSFKQLHLEKEKQEAPFRVAVWHD